MASLTNHHNNLFQPAPCHKLTAYFPWEIYKWQYDSFDSWSFKVAISLIQLFSSLIQYERELQWQLDSGVPRLSGGAKNIKQQELQGCNGQCIELSCVHWDLLSIVQCIELRVHSAIVELQGCNGHCIQLSVHWRAECLKLVEYCRVH